MRFILTGLFVCLLPFYAAALTLEEVVRLSEANVGEEVILALIGANQVPLHVSANDVLCLKKRGLSDKVIIALIKHSSPAEKQPFTISGAEERRRELSPFDQFFLSMYYSHEYGWPEPNYENPREILEQGLYYQPSTVYPNATMVRIYGIGGAYFPFNPLYPYTTSPFSLIIPVLRQGVKFYDRLRVNSGEVHLQEHLTEEKLSPSVPLSAFPPKNQVHSEKSASDKKSRDTKGK